MFTWAMGVLEALDWSPSLGRRSWIEGSAGPLLEEEWRSEASPRRRSFDLHQSP